LTTVSQIDNRGALAYVATGRGDGDRMFRRAMRHSRAVRVLRVALPLAVVLGIAGSVIAATVLDPLRAFAKLPVKLGGLVVSGTKITMQAPRLAGFTADSRPYTITARTAAQDVTNPDLLELEDLQSTMQMKDQSTFNLTARFGFYESKAEKLVLKQDVVVVGPSYEVRLIEAVINTRTGHMLSERPAEVKMQQGTINSNRMEIINSGEIIRFERGVTMDLTMDSAASAGKAVAQ
jgi:lipopolysaccharide export system protein LptC